MDMDLVICMMCVLSLLGILTAVVSTKASQDKLNIELNVVHARLRQIEGTVFPPTVTATVRLSDVNLGNELKRPYKPRARTKRRK